MYLSDIETSIKRILTTPLGSRVMEPLFGSNLHELIDKRPDQEWRLRFIRDTHAAISKWEPRVKVLLVTPARVDERTHIMIRFELLETGKIHEIEVVYD
jgi:hypothetical protein